MVSTNVVKTFSAHTAEILSIVAGTLLLVLAVVSLVFYRNWKYEQELDSLLWKVDYKDIEINDTENSSTSSKISRVSTGADENCWDDMLPPDTSVTCADDTVSFFPGGYGRHSVPAI